PTTYLVDTTLSDASDYDQTVHAVRLHFITHRDTFFLHAGLLFHGLSELWTAVISTPCFNQ
ncbi:hypothetical protein, partial [Klebsiella pneumoniae]|uniref:hypothetical protein n=1 Tax=Klebsiella pneumoniae TaxID=573 RepID=UPI00263A6D2B